MSWSTFVPDVPALPPGKSFHVFLSYRTVNRIWVINLYDVLRAHGFEVFLDRIVLKPSDTLDRELEQGLARSAAAVLVWSAAAAQSAWVQREFELMLELDRRDDFLFVPVVLDHTELPARAATKLYLDFRAYPDGPNGGELLRLLYALTGRTLPDDADHFAAEQEDIATQTNARVAAAVRNEDVAFLASAPLSDELVWTTSASLGSRAAEGLAQLGRYGETLAVCDVLDERFPRAIRPKQLRALALARRAQPGDLAEAQRILGTLYDLGERDPETLGIYARTWMDRHAASGDVRHLRQSRALYQEAFEHAPDDAYVGLNAAAKSVLIGDEEDLALAAELAGKVQELVGKEPVRDDYWRNATVAELHLLRRDWAAAARAYQAAVDGAASLVGAHATSWKQAALLMEKLQPTPEERARVRKPFAHVPD